MSQNVIYFEDMNADLKVDSPDRVVTSADIERFADLTGDTNPLHVDDTYAAESRYGERIAHGALILSLATGIAYRMETFSQSVETITDVKWKFRHPVYIGDRIRARFAFRRKHSMPGYHGGLVVFDVEMRNQHDEVVQEGRWRLMVRNKPKTTPTT